MGSADCDEPRRESPGMHTRNNGCFLLITLHAAVARICEATVIGIACGQLHFVRRTDLNALRPWQNCHHFEDDTFKSIILNENAWILLKVWLKSVLKVRLSIPPALVKIMAWRRLGHKPLSGPMIVIYWRIHTSLGLNELVQTSHNYYPLAAEVLILNV